MYQFLSDNSLFVVLIIALMIWTGISVYLFSVSKQISKLEKIIKGQELNEN